MGQPKSIRPDDGPAYVWQGRLVRGHVVYAERRDGEPDTWECQVCWAHVSNLKGHTAWHLRTS